MMQLLSLIAMEPPAKLTGDAIRDEKVKVVHSIRPFSEEDIAQSIARGQYGPSGQDKGYREEDRVSPSSTVETYVALKLYVDNWRWAGVPFYLRAGKRLPKKVTEIAISFKPAPGALYEMEGHTCPPNVLAIRIQPDEGISLKINCKIPGHDDFMKPVSMDFRYVDYFGSGQQEAYERLICDCMIGDSTLFARIDEVIASWTIFSPILDWWQAHPPKNFPNYPCGSWGPEEANKLIEEDHRSWRTP
jgi:glucose-6-phosphate 1-dehydrogenase